MSTPLNILAISGSLRKESLNRKALQIGKKIEQELGASVEEADLLHLDIPHYNGDRDGESIPEGVRTLRAMVEHAHIIMIACPEYNFSVPGVLKDAIDWVSRKGTTWSGKTAVLFGVSVGAMGTVRVQMHLRSICTELNMWVLPKPQVHIRNGGDAFNDDGSFKDQKTHELLTKLITDTHAFVATMKYGTSS